MRMGRIEINPERYQLFLDAFLANGPRFSVVARRVGCEQATAKKAWERGWPDKPYAPAISKIYGDMLNRMEAEKVRLKKAAEETVAQRTVESAPKATFDALQDNSLKLPQRSQTPSELLQESAINALQSEVDVLQAFRCNMLGAVTVANRTLVGLEKLAMATSEHLEISATNVAQASPERLLIPLERFARIMGLLAQSTKHVMEMQRLLVGAPTQIIENRGASSTIADNAELMRRAQHVFSMMQRSGLLPNESNDTRQYEGEETNTPVPDTPTREVIDISPDPP